MSTDSAKESMAILQAEGVSKFFTGVCALDKVDFDLRPGEVHALLGENGAGKSTLINLLAGTFEPDGGALKFNSERVERLSPVKARLMGISPVFQEFSLIPDLSVTDNLFLGREMHRGGFADRRSMLNRSLEILKRLGFEVDPRRKISELSRAQQQMVEIAKALLIDVKVLILDEPTASLTDKESERLFELVEQLRNQGVGIIYISHRMQEIRRLADRTTVLRDGRKVATVASRELSDSELVQLMTGRKIDLLYPAIQHEPGEVLLGVENLVLGDGSVQAASFHARGGEITGIAGLVGCGKSAAVRAVFGLEQITQGEIRVNGIKLANHDPARSLASKVCYFPANRATEGLALTRPVRENMSMAALLTRRFSRGGVLKSTAEADEASRIAKRLKLRPPNVERSAASLSGGNRQKVMLARSLTREFNVYLFDEPTVGIDVGAKLEVYELMKELVEAGAAVVVVSSDLSEIIHLSNRVYVMRSGKISGLLEGGAIDEAAVLHHFFEPGEGVGN